MPGGRSIQISGRTSRAPNSGALTSLGSTFRKTPPGKTAGAMDSLRKARRVVQAAALAAAPKGFDGVTLGGGQAGGGRAACRRARRELLDRVIAKSAPLPADIAANLDRIWPACDAALAAEHGPRWGYIFRDDMRALVPEAEGPLAGSVAAWLQRHRRRFVTKPEILV